MTEILIADYTHPGHQKAIIELLADYARDPMGGGEPLPPQVMENLIPALAAQAGAFSVLAFDADKPIGLVNCFQTLSTFKAKPLINIHDVTVKADYRGLGIGTRMLKKVEAVARQRGACKLTLEVLEGNEVAQQVYNKLGFYSYELDPAMGRALFWEKKLSD